MQLFFKYALLACTTHGIGEKVDHQRKTKWRIHQLESVNTDH